MSAPPSEMPSAANRASNGPSSAVSTGELLKSGYSPIPSRTSPGSASTTTRWTGSDAVGAVDRGEVERERLGLGARRRRRTDPGRALEQRVDPLALLRALAEHGGERRS